jgi:hypothetical protein
VDVGCESGEVVDVPGDVGGAVGGVDGVVTAVATVDVEVLGHVVVVSSVVGGG